MRHFIRLERKTSKATRRVPILKLFEVRRKSKDHQRKENLTKMSDTFPKTYESQSDSRGATAARMATARG